MQYTTNYHLAKPEGTDPVDISVLNNNADIIDTALAQGGGGSATQSDWNENDSQKASYVKNRPLYVGTEEYPNTTLDNTMERTVQDLDTVIFICYPDSLNLEVGTTYNYSITIPEFGTMESSATAEDHSDYIPGAVILRGTGDLTGIDIIDNVTSSHTAGAGCIVSFPHDIGVSMAETVSVTIYNLPQVRSTIYKLDNKFLNIEQIRKDLEDGVEFTYIIDNPYWVTQPKVYQGELDNWTEVTNPTDINLNGTYMLDVSEDYDGYALLQSVSMVDNEAHFSDTGYAIRWDDFSYDYQHNLKIPMGDGEFLILSPSSYIDCDNRYNSITDTHTVKFRSSYTKLYPYESPLFNSLLFSKNQTGECNGCYELDIEYVGTGMNNNDAFVCCPNANSSGLQGLLQTISTFGSEGEVKTACSETKLLDAVSLGAIRNASAIRGNLVDLDSSGLSNYLVGCHFHHNYRISKEFIFAEYNDSIYSSTEWRYAGLPSFIVDGKMRCSRRIDKDDWVNLVIGDFSGCNGTMLRITFKELNPITATGS